MAWSKRIPRKCPEVSREAGPQQITCNTINAGIYVLEPIRSIAFPLMCRTRSSGSYFPSLIERSETFVAYLYKGYWIDIGTTRNTCRWHRDINGPALSRRALLERSGACVARAARVEEGAIIEGPCFIDADAW